MGGPTVIYGTPFQLLAAESYVPTGKQLQLLRSPLAVRALTAL